MARTATRRRARKGTFDDAFDALYGRAHSTARAMVGDDVLAEEICVEALARLCADWSRLVRRAPAEAWAARFVVPLALDEVARREALLDLVDLAPDARMQPDEARALRSLPRQRRDAVALACFSRLAPSDIAAVLGMSDDALERELDAGRDALHEALDDAQAKGSRGRA